MIVPAAPVPALSQAAGVAHHYDELDPFYRNLWGEHLHHGLWRSGSGTPAVAVLQLLELVADRAQLEPGARVCDVGAGYGASARWLAARYGAQVTALTLSPAQYAYACAQPTVPGVPTPRYLLQDSLSNTLPDSSADVVIALESTEHMADLKECFAQLRRVLRPGGRFVICAWLARETPEPWEIRLLLEPVCREGRLAGLGSMSEYRSALGGPGSSSTGETTSAVRFGAPGRWCCAACLPGCSAKAATGATCSTCGNANASSSGRWRAWRSPIGRGRCVTGS